MKALIITEGGEGIGFGHIARCLSFSQALKKKGITPEFIINGSIKSKDLETVKRHRIFNWLEQKERLFKMAEESDIAIIDSYLATSDIYDKISQLAKKPVYIDDNNRLRYPKGIVVNGTMYAGRLDYPRQKGTTYLAGSRYIPLRREFWNVPSKNIKKTIAEILITFGGDDSKNMTARVLKTLKEKCKNMRKFVIIGRSFDDAERIKRLADKRTNFIYSPSAAMMKKVMLRSDIAITAGGQTLYELARTGTPSVGICIAENQRRNLEAWHKAGVVEYIGWFNDKDLSSKLLKGLDKISGYAVRVKKSGLGRHFVDGKGVERIIAGIT